MLRNVIAFAACLIGASAASAQFVTAPGVIGNPGGPVVQSTGPASNSVANVPFFDYRTAPQAKAERLKKALALREQAYAWRAADGGTLSKGHLRIINRKAAEILSY